MRSLVAGLLVLVACGSSLPSPPKGKPPATAFGEVPYPPPPARPERVPERPPGHPVWVDGSWEWTGTRWRWKDGGWYARPARGVVFDDWAIDRPGGTRLTFAAAGWRDAKGTEVPAPPLLASASMNPAARDAGTDEAEGAAIDDAGPGLDGAPLADSQAVEALAADAGRIVPAADGGSR